MPHKDYKLEYLFRNVSESNKPLFYEWSWLFKDTMSNPWLKFDQSKNRTEALKFGIMCETANERDDITL
jgi:hypothetical protein